MQGEKEKRLSYMKCANCGTELKDGTLFCPVCKSEIQWVPEYHTLETILLQKQMREKNLKEKKQKKEEEIVLNLEQLERQTIEKAMKLSEGNISRAADYLGITRFALYRKLEKLGL